MVDENNRKAYHDKRDPGSCLIGIIDDVQQYEMNCKVKIKKQAGDTGLECRDVVATPVIQIDEEVDDQKGNDRQVNLIDGKIRYYQICINDHKDITDRKVHAGFYKRIPVGCIYRLGAFDKIIPDASVLFYGYCEGF